MAQKNTPGPVGMSCLTCKQRHKKCDLRQPACLKCQEGGLECLGYGHNRRGVVCSGRSKASRPRPILPKGQKPKCSPDMLLTGTSLRHKPSIGSAHFEGNLSLDSEASNERTGVLDSSSNLLFPSRASHSAVAIRVQQQDKNAEALAVQDYLRLFTPKDYGEYSTTLSSSHHFSAVLGGLTSSPSDPTMSYLNSGDFEVYFMSHIKRMMDFTYFKPHQVQADQLHAIIVSRIRGSNFRRWVMLLSARISEAIIDGEQSQTNVHTRWIEDIETTIHRKLEECPTPQETEVLHADRIEVSLLKTSMSRNCNMYTILRNAAPIFLQHVYSLPEIWSGSSDPTTIPLMNIIGSKHHALVAFTLFDCTCAMAFGLPQQVDYDTSIGVFPRDFLPHEWAYSTPTEFHILLAEINACRDKSTGAHDWKEIEYTLVHWESRIAQDNENWESWMVVAWFAVQESWRLALLAYLYLAVCGLPSDDERIQRCVTQIVQVVSTVKKREASEISVPLFVQYLMVGICARNEKDRKIARTKLSNVVETKFWPVRGVGFVPVLDDLWHGAGANGHPVTWNDYLRSREALLPT